MRLKNGKFYTSAVDRHPASRLEISGGVVMPSQDGPTYDLGNRTALPGLTDAHLHIFPLALFRLQLDVAGAGVTSIPALCAALAAISQEQQYGGWLQGAALLEDLFEERRLPTRSDLDAAFPDTPVLLRRYCGHVAVMNSCALDALGLLQSVPTVSSGAFARDADGALTGHADEGAASWVFHRAPAPPDGLILSEIKKVLNMCVGFGLTALVEAAVGFTLGYDREVAIWDQLRNEGGIPVRLGFMNELTAQDAAKRGLTPIFDRDWSSETLKYFADGIIGGRTGALSEPYEDTGGFGDLMHPVGVLEREFADAHAAGWRIAVHATGDRGIDRVLSSLNAAQGHDTSRRHRIEHFFVPPPDGIMRAARDRVSVVTQPGFLFRMGASIARGLGARTDGAIYPGASVLQAGAPLVFSSDAPTGPLSPWSGVRYGVERIGAHGGQIGPGEAVSRPQAINAYITGGAYAMRHEAFRGKLSTGQAADIIVLNMDPFTAPLDELSDCACVFATKDGKVVLDQL